MAHGEGPDGKCDECERLIASRTARIRGYHARAMTASWAKLFLADISQGEFTRSMREQVEFAVTSAIDKAAQEAETAGSPDAAVAIRALNATGGVGSVGPL